MTLRRCSRILLLLSFALQSAPALSAGDPMPRKDMRIMAKGLGRVLPFALSDTALENPAVLKTIGTNLDAMIEAARRVEAKLPQAIDDPIMRDVPTRLSASLIAARRDLKAGNFSRMKTRLLRPTAYCIACHTRTAGSEASIKIEPDFGEGELSSLDKAEFYTATRQFPAAILQFEAALNDAWFANKYPHRWERAAKQLLALTVRVEQKPRLVLELLAKLRDSKTAPAALRRDLEIWKGAVKEWTDASPEESAPTLANAQRLLKQGDDRVARTGSKEAGLIDHLRSSALIHLLLQAPASAETAEGLFLAGTVTERLAFVNWTALHEIYYESCVRRAPHTPLARRCFERFKALQLMTGVNDFKMPTFADDVDDRLDGLEKLAQ